MIYGDCTFRRFFTGLSVPALNEKHRSEGHFRAVLVNWFSYVNRNSLLAASDKLGVRNF